MPRWKRALDVAVVGGFARARPVDSADRDRDEADRTGRSSSDRNASGMGEALHVLQVSDHGCRCGFPVHQTHCDQLIQSNARW